MVAFMNVTEVNEATSCGITAWHRANLTEHSGGGGGRHKASLLTGDYSFKVIQIIVSTDEKLISDPGLSRASYTW